jgi:hypothetical protein
MLFCTPRPQSAPANALKSCIPDLYPPARRGCKDDVNSVQQALGSEISQNQDSSGDVLHYLSRLCAVHTPVPTADHGSKQSQGAPYIKSHGHHCWLPGVWSPQALSKQRSATLDG